MKKALIMVSFVLFITGCTAEQLIGGQRDEHGCLSAAGYRYDTNISACTRSWELNDNQAEAAKIAIEHLSPNVSATITSVAVARCPGCFIVNVRLHFDSGDEDVQVYLEEWNVVESMTEINEENGLSPSECEAIGGRPLNIVAGDTCNETELNYGLVIGFISPNICCVPRTEPKMTEAEAIIIAENSTCVSEGTLTDKIIYNSASNTYWIDLNLTEEMSGCNPACVVSEVTKTAEINYRCTGLIIE